MPVLVWGNGACSDDGTSAQNMLAQVASHGFVAIASGPPGTLSITVRYVDAGSAEPVSLEVRLPGSPP